MNEKIQLLPIKNDIETGLINLSSVKTSTSILNTSISSIDSSSPLDELSEMQPSLHESRKSCWELYCCKIFFANYDLTKNEYKKFNSLRKECLILFEENNQSHEKLLKDLLDNYTEICACNENEKLTASWKNLGFQTENPRTDFRAAGFYSLKFMHYFAWKYPNELIKMVKLDYFLFAVISIRLTYIYKLFLNLVKDDELQIGLKSHKVNSCSRKQFKNFCYYLNHNENILIILLSKSLINIRERFILQFNEHIKELNFLLIDPLIKHAVTCVEKILETKIHPDNLEILVDKIFKEELNNK